MAAAKMAARKIKMKAKRVRTRTGSGGGVLEHSGRNKKYSVALTGVPQTTSAV